MGYVETCRAAAKEQMPGVPASLIDALPIDEAPDGGMYLAQTGGFTMCLAHGSRLMSECGDAADGDLYLVTDEPNGGEYGHTLYSGNSADEALAALTGGVS